MFVILQGKLQAGANAAARPSSLTLKPGDVTGTLPFSRMKQFYRGARRDG
jgi:hypothetical protein